MTFELNEEVGPCFWLLLRRTRTWFTGDFDPRLSFSRTIPYMVGKIMTCEDVHFPTSRTCEYVNFPGKGKLRLLINWSRNGESMLVYPGGPYVATKVLTNERQRGVSIREMQREKDSTSHCRLCGQKGRAQAKECRQPLGNRKSKDTGSSLEIWGGTQLCWHLNFHPDPFQTSDIQKLKKIMNLPCFKLPGLWWFL